MPFTSFGSYTLSCGQVPPEYLIASRLSESIHRRAYAASRSPMFHSSLAFFNITQFLSLQVDPRDKENPGPAAPPEDDPIQVSLLAVRGAENAGATGIYGA